MSGELRAAELVGTPSKDAVVTANMGFCRLVFVRLKPNNLCCSGLSLQACAALLGSSLAPAPLKIHFASGLQCDDGGWDKSNSFNAYIYIYTFDFIFIFVPGVFASPLACSSTAAFLGSI